MKMRTKYFRILLSLWMVSGYGQLRTFNKAIVPNSLVQKNYTELNYKFDNIKIDFIKMIPLIRTKQYKEAFNQFIAVNKAVIATSEDVTQPYIELLNASQVRLLKFFEGITLHKKIVLANSINGNRMISKIWLISLSVILLLIAAFTYYYYRKQRTYRIKFKALLNEKSSGKKILTKSGAATVADLNMSETAFNKITEKLKLFIEEKHFLDNDVSLNNWAKAMDTNPRYLSKVINFYEEKSFNIYIKELRIHYAVEELKTNPVLRKYSITAIAEEIGFNNTQTFSRAFYEETGIKPSYFIRELEKEILKKSFKTGVTLKQEN